MGAAEQSIAGQILAIGEILVDFIVADGATSLDAAETFVARSGGAPANACRRTGQARSRQRVLRRCRR